MRLPPDWDAEKASGWWELHHLIHKPCRMRTGMTYDLWGTDPNYGEAAVRQVVYGHTCEGEGE